MLDIPVHVPKEVREVVEEISSYETHFSDEAFFFILDHKAKNIVWTSTNVNDMLGFDVSQKPYILFLSFLRIIQKEDLKQFVRHQKKLKQNFPDWGLKKTLPIRVAQDVRIKSAYRGQMRLLIQQQILVSDRNTPHWSVGSGMNISHIKEEEELSLAVFDTENNELTLEKVIGWSKEKLFTAREMDILQLLSKGYKSKDIEDILNIRLNTVRTHRRNMLKKIGLENTTQLINFAIKEGIIK